MAVAKATIINDIWKEFKDALATGVTTVTLTDATTQTIQTYTESFPKSIIDETSDYPIMIIYPPSINWSDFTFTKKWVNGTINIEVYSTKNEAADKFIDAIINTVETNRDDWQDDKIMFIQLQNTSSDAVMRSDIHIHIRSATFNFKYPFTKTKP